MLKRFNNIQLGIVLGVLALCYLFSFVFNSGGDRTFKKDLAVIDTAKVSNIIIKAPDQNEEISLNKQEGNWMVTRPDGNSFPASKTTVNTALSQISSLTAIQLVSTNSDDYSDFKVDSSGTYVQVFEGNSKVFDAIVGRNEFQQTGMSTYIRTENEKEVYAIRGSLGTALNKEANDWRDKTLIKGTSSNWKKLTFSYPSDSSFQIVLSGSDWKLPDSTALDNGSVRSYLSSISNLNGTKIVDRNVNSGTSAIFSLVIEGLQEPIRVYAYPDEEEEYIITSNLNGSAFFSGKQGNVWKRIFVNVNKFLLSEGA